MKRTTRKDYPPNWQSEIVPAVKARAQNRCEHCGLENGQSVWLYKKNGVKHWATSFGNAKCLGDAFPEREIKVVCCAAHLDHDETNMHITMDRLAFLCQKCHLKHDFQDNLDRLHRNRKWVNKRMKFKLLVNRYKR